MKYTIRELESEFRDFETSLLIAELVQDGYEDEATGDEIEVAVDEWPEGEEFFSTDGHSWAEQQAEARAAGKKAYSVADVTHTWYMGLVMER